MADLLGDCVQKQGTKRKLSSNSGLCSSSSLRLDNTSYSGSDGPKNLPSHTSRWNQTSLEVVRMYPEFSSRDEPCEILEKSLKSLWGEKMYKHYSKEVKSSRGRLNFQEIKSFIMELSDCLLNRNHVGEVTLVTIHNMRASVREFMNNTNINITPEALELWGSEWKCLMKAAAERFCNQLEHIHLSHMKTDRYEEGMFQTLFMHFLEICNLTVFGFSNVTSKNVKIKQTQLTSTPDILVMDCRDCEEEVTAVVDVKRGSGKQDMTETKFTRSGRSPNYVDECRNVSIDLIGQHGGQLLSHLPDSIFCKKGIFGMIVQATEVTVTFLDAENGYFDAVETLFEDKQCSSKIYLSTECNLLSKDDRRELVGFLAELAFLQRLKKLNTHRKLFQIEPYSVWFNT